MAPPSLRDAFRPLTRTGGYYARSWRDYIVDDSPQLPVVRPTVALAVEALRDEVVLLGLRARRPVSDVAVVQSGLVGGCDGRRAATE